jgi:hypothetical protein
MLLAGTRWMWRELSHRPQEHHTTGCESPQKTDFSTIDPRYRMPKPHRALPFAQSRHLRPMEVASRLKGIQPLKRTHGAKTCAENGSERWLDQRLVKKSELIDLTVVSQSCRQGGPLIGLFLAKTPRRSWSILLTKMKFRKCLQPSVTRSTRCNKLILALPASKHIQSHKHFILLKCETRQVFLISVALIHRPFWNVYAQMTSLLH